MTSDCRASNEYVGPDILRQFSRLIAIPLRHPIAIPVASPVRGATENSQMNQRLKIAGAALAGIVATVAAGGIAIASMDNGLGGFGRADANNDGQITRAEWVQAATARFDRFDANKDGKLIGDELPKHGRGGPDGHHGHRGPHGGGPDWDRGGPPPPPDAAAPQPGAPAAAAPVAAPAPQK
jgi:hypothetical protein